MFVISFVVLLFLLLAATAAFVWYIALRQAVENHFRNILDRKDIDET